MRRRNFYMNDKIKDIDFEMDEAVCICSGTIKSRIIELIIEGHNLDTVSRKTGAYSGCGACEYDLEVLFKIHGS
jgi:bacterioferritin-associated ferredoxin